MPGISICIVHCHFPGLTGFVSAMAAGAVSAAATSRVTARVRVFMVSSEILDGLIIRGSASGRFDTRHSTFDIGSPTRAPKFECRVSNQDEDAHRLSHPNRRRSPEGCTHPAQFMTPFS